MPDPTRSRVAGDRGVVPRVVEIGDGGPHAQQHGGERYPAQLHSASAAERMFGCGMPASMAQSGTIFMSP
ncbi:hypothetical protein [Burkholderia ambifaria]